MTLVGDASPTAGEVAALVRRCVAVDGVAPLGGHVLEAIGQPGDTRYLSHADAGRLTAVAVLPAADPAELAVDPKFRRRGIGGALLDQVLDGGGPVWAHGDLPAARALARSRGLRTLRTLVQLRRPVGGAGQAVPAELPAGVRLRTFVSGVDDAAFLQVNARAFAWHPEQGRLDQVGLDAEKQQDWFDPDGFFLAVDASDRLLGYHWTKVHAIDPTPGTSEPAPIGEVFVLGVDPQSPTRRLGTPLLAAGLDYLRERGLATVMLYSEGDNDKALALYRRFGFQPYLTDVVYARR